MTPQQPETPSCTISVDLPAHCQHRFPSGRRCRQALFDPQSRFCPDHAARYQTQLEQADLSALLIGDTKEFHSALDINRTLGELLKLEASNKITPRRAAVMAYTCNLLLRTLPVIAHELHPVVDPNRIIIDMPGPTRD